MDGSRSDEFTMTGNLPNRPGEDDPSDANIAEAVLVLHQVVSLWRCRLENV